MADGLRKALVAGATGLVGFELVKQLCADESVSEVHVLVRRAFLFQHEKIIEHCVDFSALNELPSVHEVYLAIGTTIKIAGSKQAFKAADYGANLAVAKAAIKAGARKIGLVSAMGANAQSPVFYSRVKGELEETLKALNPDTLVLAHPSLLRGDRKALGQPMRKGEERAIKLDNFFKPLMPKAFRAIEAKDVAAALVHNVPIAKGVLVLSSKVMQDASLKN